MASAAIGAAAAGGIDAFTSAASGMASNLFGAREAKKARKWAKKMYKRRYQFTMEDMRKAGLNPILAAQIGAGSAPSAAVASPSPGGAGAPMSAAMAWRQGTQQLRNARAVEGNTAADTANKWRQGEILDASLVKANAEKAYYNELGPFGIALDRGMFATSAWGGHKTATETKTERNRVVEEIKRRSKAFDASSTMRALQEWLTGGMR